MGEFTLWMTLKICLTLTQWSSNNSLDLMYSYSLQVELLVEINELLLKTQILNSNYLCTSTLIKKTNSLHSSDSYSWIFYDSHIVMYSDSWLTCLTRLNEELVLRTLNLWVQSSTRVHTHESEYFKLLEYPGNYLE